MRLDDIVAQLNKRKQRATYGAVAGVVGGWPRWLMKGRARCPCYSWVVAKHTGSPTGYAESQIDPDCRSQIDRGLPKVIEDAASLRAWLHECSRTCLTSDQKGGRLPVDCNLMHDRANKANNVAGNGGDLVKHTVYLAVLRFLLGQEPWRSKLLVRECHAGQGAYRIPEGDSRRHRLLSCLYSSPAGSSRVLLHDVQKSILGTLGCWPSGAEGAHCYAGSPLINAYTLAESHGDSHELELYELLPETRRILRSVLAEAQPEAHQFWSVLPKEEQCKEFDGEAHIAREIKDWGKQNLVLLDPFAMWRQRSDQAKRDRYGAIIDGLVSRGPDAPSLVLFWTWGKAFPVADADLDGTASPVPNGYAELRAKLHKAGFAFILIRWRWELQFAMWVVVPADHVTALRDAIDCHCRLLSDHLTRHGCGQSQVEVTIDLPCRPRPSGGR